MRFAILVSFALLALPFTGCKPAPAPSFPVTEVVAPDSPDDQPQPFVEPSKPVSVPARTPEAPAGYECRDGVCGPRAESESGPVRRVFSRLPVLRRFGR